MIEKAIEIAVQYHAGQLRKDSCLPYVVHPIEVMKSLSDIGISDVDILAAAVLHDIIEDTSYTFEDVEKNFNLRIANIVKELTKEDKGYLASFATKSLESLVIKLIDKIMNVLDYSNTNEVYAKIYWKKASILVEIFNSKTEEIKTKFGIEVVNYIIDMISLFQYEG